MIKLCFRKLVLSIFRSVFRSIFRSVFWPVFWLLFWLLFVFGAAPGLAVADMRGPLNTATLPISQRPHSLSSVTIQQKLGAQVPLSLEFRDELGHPVRLSEIIREHPVVLTLAYFRCPGLCTLVLNGLTEAMKGLPDSMKLGRDFRALTVSINPAEGPRLALAKKRAYLTRYGYALPPISSPINSRDDFGGWRMLTGDEASIRKLADSVGYGYAYDPGSGTFSHASVLIVLTPQGRVSQYLFGIRYPSADLLHALRQAAAARVGSPIAAVLLYCFHYDPSTGRYSLRIFNLMRVFAALTLGAVLSYLLGSFLKERLA